jgi:hypothetical protein
MFDGFDYLGRPTGKKCMICTNQSADCEFQKTYGEGLFLVCSNDESLKLEKCIKDEYKKCIDSPAYFINNYMVIKTSDGRLLKPNKVTDGDIDNIRKSRWKKRH